MPALTNKHALTAYHRPHSPMAEAYRGLRTNLRYSMNDPRTILVTSSLSGEGKTTTAANLAVVCAQEGKKVLLVDAQLRSPQIHDIFALSNRAGLTNVLSGQHMVQEVANDTQLDNLSILTSGPQTNHPYELLGKERMGWALEEMRKSYDVVLIDSPPALTATDALLLAVRCEGVLLVVNSGKSTVPDTITVKNKLEQVGAAILGVVLNKRRGQKR